MSYDDRVKTAIEKLERDLADPTLTDPNGLTPAERARNLAKQMERDKEKMIAETRFTRFHG